MSDAVDATIKIIDGHIPPEQRKYIRALMKLNYPYRHIAENFIEVYPEYLESAERKGCETQELIEKLSERFRKYKQSPDWEKDDSDDALKTQIICVLNSETLSADLDYNFDPNLLEAVRSVVRSAIREYEVSSDYDESLKRAKQVVSLLSNFENIFIKRMNLRNKLEKDVIARAILALAKQDVVKVDASRGNQLSFAVQGEMDGDDDSLWELTPEEVEDMRREQLRIAAQEKQEEEMRKKKVRRLLASEA